MFESISAPPPTSILFARGIIARLAVWPVMRIAIEQGWGGPRSLEKRRWLASMIVDAFEQQDPTPDATYVEEMLLQVMEDEFDVSVEDSSADVVASDIVNLWTGVHRGELDMLHNFERQAENVKGKSTGVWEVTNDDEWEDEDDASDITDDEAEPPQLLNCMETAQNEEAEVDEDGFTLVRSKGKSRK